MRQEERAIHNALNYGKVQYLPRVKGKRWQRGFVPIRAGLVREVGLSVSGEVREGPLRNATGALVNEWGVMELENKTTDDAFARVNLARVGAFVGATDVYLLELRRRLEEFAADVTEELAKRCLAAEKAAEAENA